jgi:hypothetical protein
MLDVAASMMDELAMLHATYRGQMPAAPVSMTGAVAGRGPGVRDVAYFLCNSLPVATRRGEQRALLDRYRQFTTPRRASFPNTGPTIDE